MQKPLTFESEGLSFEVLTRNKRYHFKVRTPKDEIVISFMSGRLLRKFLALAINGRKGTPPMDERFRKGVICDVLREFGSKMLPTTKVFKECQRRGYSFVYATFSRDVGDLVADGLVTRKMKHMGNQGIVTFLTLVEDS